MKLRLFIIIPPFDIIERKTPHAIVSKRFGLIDNIECTDRKPLFECD